MWCACQLNKDNKGHLHSRPLGLMCHEGLPQARCEMTIPGFVSAEARDLIKRLLVLDPEKRIPLDEVERHPWIVKHCVKGERAYNRASGEKKEKSAGAQ